ncbi:MAG: PEP-utilizing enzyme [archaeon]
MEKKELLDFVKRNEFELQTVKASNVVLTAVYESYIDEFAKTRIDYNLGMAYIRADHLFSQVTTKKCYLEISDELYSWRLRDPGRIDGMIGEAKAVQEEMDRIWRINRSKIAGLSDSQLGSLFRKVYKLVKVWWRYGLMGEDKGEFIRSHLTPAFARRDSMDEQKAGSIISELSHPTEPAAFTLERKTFLKMCAHVLSDEKLKKGIGQGDLSALRDDRKLRAMIKSYLDEFFWFKTDFYTAVVLGMDDVIDQLKTETAGKRLSDISKELKQTDNMLLSIKEQKKKLSAKMKLSKEDKRDIKFAESFTYWLDQRKVSTMKQVYYTLVLSKEIASRFGICYDDIMVYSKDQVLELIEHGKKMDDHELKMRRSGFLSVFKRGEQPSYFYGADANEIFGFIDRTDSKELKGMVASKGKGNETIITGIAHVILHPDQEELLEGEILVTSMTRIEFVPLMRKAKAIITDEGGVACHAAIVSRELGIPCIIGTKKATKVLNDGDKIEMNIVDGVVRKISSEGIIEDTSQEVNWLHDVPNQRVLGLIAYMLMDGINKQNDYYERKIKDIFVSIKNVFSARICYSEQDIREGADRLLALCSKDKDFLKKTRKKMTVISTNILNTARQLDQINRDNEKELIHLFVKLYSLYVDFWTLFLIPELSVDFIEKEFAEEVKKQLPDDTKHYSDILLALPGSFLKEEEKELLSISRQKNFNKLLDEHVRKYFWLENNYVDTKYLDKEYFVRKLENLKDLKLAEEPNFLKEKKKFFATLKGRKYDKLKILAMIIEFLVSAQDYRKRIVMEASHYFNSLLRRIAEMRGYQEDDIYLMSPYEIINDVKVSHEELAKRRLHQVWYYHDGKAELFTGEEANRAQGRIAPLKMQEDKSVFKGTPVYQGKVNGKVRVIRSINELPKLQDGEIIVTSNTTPDYVPFLRQAKAIIAEKGGITSHAAIISREMKKPCIIGIKHVTLMLKTGDIVEVDANNGVVKVIK